MPGFSPDNLLNRHTPIAVDVTRWGICLYLAMLAIPIGPELPLMLLAALVFLTLASSSFSIASVRRGVLIALCLFLASTLVSCLLSVSLKVSIIACLSVIPGLFLFVVITHIFSLDQLGLITTILTITGLLIACVFCTVAFANPGISAQEWVDIAGYPHIGVPNDLGILSIIAAVAVARLYFGSHKPITYLSIATVFSILACLVLYKSRGSIVTLMLTVTLMVAFSRPRQIATVLLILLAVIFSVDLLTGLSFSSKLMQLDRLSVRLPLWISAWQMFLDAPLFGLGPGSYSLLYEDYLSRLELPAWIRIDDRHMPWPHNLYLELLAERGVTGLLTFSLFIAALYRTAHVSLQSGMGMSGRTTLLAAVLALTALLVSGIYESSLLRHWVLIMFFLFAGIICAAWKSRNWSAVHPQ